MDTLKQVGARLRKARRAKQIRQADLAGRVGIRQDELSRIEYGRFKGVSYDTLYRIDEALGLWHTPLRRYWIRVLDHPEYIFAHYTRGKARYAALQFFKENYPDIGPGLAFGDLRCRTANPTRSSRLHKSP